MADQFREVASALARLKADFSEGRISQQEFIDALKQLRIRDGAGRFWMIGVQSGKWYCSDGSGWVQAEPPSASERKAICIYCGYENDLEAETCARCGSDRASAADERLCPRCGRRLEEPEGSCPVCRQEAGTGAASAASASGLAVRPAPAGSLVLRAVHPVSFFWFFGILGVFGGMLLGLLVGVTGLFPGFVSSLPAFLTDIQGKLLGGVVYTIAGGLFGFVAGGPAGFLLAAVSNGILSLVGGVRVQAVAGPPSEPASERAPGPRRP